MAIVCGDRHWAEDYRPGRLPSRDRGVEEYRLLHAVLDDIHSLRRIEVVFEGEQRGVDLLARHWAESRYIRVEPTPALWDVHGECFCPPGEPRCKMAGPRRNRVQLRKALAAVEGDPAGVICIAFHRNFNESKGTKDMVQIARRAGIESHIFPGHGVGMDWQPGIGLR